MEVYKDMFNERIPIEGMSGPIYFIFRMLHGEEGMRYKVRSTNPVSDFNMENGMDRTAAKFKFSDQGDVPTWLLRDADAQKKLSNAIKYSNSK